MALELSQQVLRWNNSKEVLDQPLNFSFLSPQNFCVWTKHIHISLGGDWGTVPTATFMRTDIFLVIGQWISVICYRRFGTTQRSKINGSRIQKDRRQPCYDFIENSRKQITFSTLWFPTLFSRTYIHKIFACEKRTLRIFFLGGGCTVNTATFIRTEIFLIISNE